MSDAFNTFASALEQRGKVRYFGSGQLRAACPCCGEKNTGTLSAKAGDTGAVLVKCWKSGCSPDQIATAVGLEITDLFPEREREDGKPFSKPRRIGLMPAMQALELLHDEAWLVMVAAENLANGYALTDSDRQRLRDAAGTIKYVTDEAKQ